MTRTCRRSSLPRPDSWRFTSLISVIWLFACPFDYGEVTAVLKAAQSLMIPLTKEAIRVARARSIQG